jgi:hypothetical protein
MSEQLAAKDERESVVSVQTSGSDDEDMSWKVRR